MGKLMKRLFLYFIVIVLIVIGWKLINIQYTKKYISPDKTNIVKIEVGTATLFGPTNINIKCRKNTVFGFLSGKTIDTTISNDGKNINESNINIEWINENNATITLYGEEQSDKTIEVNFDDEIKYNY